MSTGPAEVFFGLWRADFRPAFVGLPSPPRSLGSSACSLNDPSDPTGRPENGARLRHGRGDDVRIVALLRRTLVKEIAVDAPRFQSRFHRRSGDHLIEETQRSLIRLQFSRHELSTARAASPRNERTARPVRDISRRTRLVVASSRRTRRTVRRWSRYSPSALRVNRRGVPTPIGALSY